MKDNIVFGFLNPSHNLPSQRKGKPEKRRDKWHSAVFLCQKNSHFEVSSYHMFYEKTEAGLLKEVSSDIRTVSPKTKIHPIELNLKKVNDLSELFITLRQFLNTFKFKPESKRYFFHLTSGLPDQQLVASKLAQTNIFPGKLLHVTHLTSDVDNLTAQIIDPDWYHSDKINRSINHSYKESGRYLKAGIDTVNKAYNALIKLLEEVTVKNSLQPLLICGPEGSGKSSLARRLYELKRQRGFLEGKYIRLNCASLSAESTLSTLTGNGRESAEDNNRARHGLFGRVNKGMLYLDDVNELESHSQALLLDVLENNQFLPTGSSLEVETKFQLVASTSVDISQLVREGLFREDLFARLSLWTFHLPALRDRTDDVEPNLDFELKYFEKHQGKRIRFKPDAREAFLKFAKHPSSAWSGNFRDFSTSITRMGSLAASGWIDTGLVDAEMATLNHHWAGTEQPVSGEASVNLAEFLSNDVMANVDNFDIPQLKHVIWVCQQSRSAADAGRRLFNHSRTQKRSSNDTSRLAKYLSRFDLQFSDVAGNQDD